MISAFGVDHGEVSKAFSLPGMKAGVGAMKNFIKPGVGAHKAPGLGSQIKTGANSLKPNLKPLGAGAAVGGAGGFAMGNRKRS